MRGRGPLHWLTALARILGMGASLEGNVWSVEGSCNVDIGVNADHDLSEIFIQFRPYYGVTLCLRSKICGGSVKKWLK